MFRTFFQLTDAVILHPADLLLQHLLVDHVGVLQVVVAPHRPRRHHLQAVRPFHRHGDQGNIDARVNETRVVTEQLGDLCSGGSLGWYGVPAAAQETGPEVIMLDCKERTLAAGLIF